MSEPVVLVFGSCYLCGRVFGFNPHRVPSYDPSLDDPSKPVGRQPICEDCIGRVNERRAAAGLATWEVYPDSYEPISPGEL